MLGAWVALGVRGPTTHENRGNNISKTVKRACVVLGTYIQGTHLKSKPGIFCPSVNTLLPNEVFGEG